MHFLRYVLSKARERANEDTYRSYIADALKAIAENTARMYGGTVMSRRYCELGKKPDNRSAEEVAMDVIERAGLKVI